MTMNKKANGLPVIILVLFLPILTFSQSADEIISAHLEAHGGQAALDRVEAIRVTGKYTAFSIEHDFACFKTRDGSYYADLYLGDKRVIESIHDGSAWTIDPWQEMDYARCLSEGEVNVMKQKAEFITPFLNKAEGNEVEYLGRDTLDGLPMQVLKLTRTNGKSETWYLDAETYLEYKCVSDWVDFAYVVPAETYFDDFREVNGLLFPFFVERTFLQRDRILVVEDISVNPEIDTSLFVMPRRPEMDKLAFLEGSWEVIPEVLTRKGTWYPLGRTTSSISFVSTNLLEEEVTFERIFRITKRRQFAFNENTGYRVSEYDALATSLTLYDANLSDTAFIFREAGTGDGESGTVTGSIERYTISPVEGDSFVLERQVSQDGGTSWTAQDRFKYARRSE